ncbi:MAG: hypothetical protein JJ850_04430 [Kordiimonadaceae bacterium]|nr:hypothetical protein [Kordiimonadaceae bacterium]MBO6568435.1 hypothetical protein [Kordiimonadaceae bacterium]MBO6963836.1 hypothetical protein [Kordiimonadaceae bacterium]
MTREHKANISGIQYGTTRLKRWISLVDDVAVPANPPPLYLEHRQSLLDVITQVLDDAGASSPNDRANRILADTLTGNVLHSSAIDTWKKIFSFSQSAELIKAPTGIKASKVALAPATDVVLENLDWFRANFDVVRVGDNLKAGQRYGDIEIEPMAQLVSEPDDVDCYLMTTDTPEVQDLFSELLPQGRTTHVYELRDALSGFLFPASGYHRADRILEAIEQVENPLVVFGRKLLPTTEPIFLALQEQGANVFQISQFDRMERLGVCDASHDNEALIDTNAILTFSEALYILIRLKKGRFWIYYDFFYNVGWDADRAVDSYAFAAGLLKIAARPTILGMYDVIKPVCLNMEQTPEMARAYKAMVEAADALVLTSKSDHVADYLRNTIARDKPVKSFYRYSFPPPTYGQKLSDMDGERHLVGVTSFLGEVFEPNRIETRNSIRSLLRQKIHFHYYSSNTKVIEFQSGLSEAERRFFHVETPIWDQAALIKDMSQFDAGWLVGDEATIFAKLICSIEDRNVRELFTLFVPNGVPTSSMTYGAAGLPVFISRQIKVMSEVYPEGCCIPLDMGEVDNIAAIFEELDWKTLHSRMQAERNRFDVRKHTLSLVTFLANLKP